MAPKVSIIAVNYNGVAYTLDFLRSITQISYPNFDIYVVDNGSTQDPSEIPAAFPDIHFLKTGKNLGFSGGNNAAIKVSDADYFLLINNDTEVPKGFLEPLVSRMEREENIGIVCPKIKYFDSPTTFQFAGFTPIHPITGRGHSIGEHEEDTGQYEEELEISRPHGAAMLIKRKAFEEAGLLADIFFLYYEEMDLADRFLEKGYRILYVPQSEIWHKESMTTGKNSTLKTYYLSRNRILYLRRNRKGATLLFAFLYYHLVAIPKNLLIFAIKGEWPHFKAYWKGVLWNVQHFYHPNLFKNEFLTGKK
ncbi:MAG: glycosyltransferase family 2 protein [Schleiferiaceae bacterium]|nr:glycosyltransferase family 2 protein [Schleiferiaceae bacterium]